MTHNRLKTVLASALLMPIALYSQSPSPHPTPQMPEKPDTVSTRFIRPDSLATGDTIAVISPSSIIKPQIVYKALPVLARQGWTPIAYPHAFDRYGTFAGTDDNRYSDLKAALLDPSVKTILCSRGGYGAVHLLERLDSLPLSENPKWLIGYSDVSALHALMSKHGIMSIHAPMCKHIAEKKGADEDSQRLFDILRGTYNDIAVNPDPLNRHGSAKGRIAGGNLAVIAGLIGTPFDVIKPGTILFIEDIAEPVYKVERILYNLRLNGSLGNLAGLIVGQFTDYKQSPDHVSMETMIASMVSDYDYPVAFNVPIGHVDHNIPIIVGAEATLTVDTDGMTLKYNLPK